MIIEPVHLVTALGVVLGLIGVLAGIFAARLSDLERQVQDAEDYLDEMWVWARKLLDLYYRHRRDDGPDPDPIPKRRQR